MSEPVHSSEASESRQADRVGVELTPAQLSQVIAALGNRERPRFTFDDLVKLVNVVAVIAAGIWTVNEYFQFRRTIQHVQLEQQRREADYAAERPLTVKIRTTVQRVEPRGAKTLYAVQLLIDIKNNSRNVIFVSSADVRLFRGAVTTATTDTDAVLLNGPRLPSGAIRWREAVATTFVTDDAPKWAADSLGKALERQGKSIVHGCPAFGRMIAGEDYGECSIDFYVVAHPDEWIGFTEDFQIAYFAAGRGGRMSEVFTFDQWRRLKDEGQQTASGVPIPE